MLIAHLSDLHVSRFGEHVSSLRGRGLHGRAARGEWTHVQALDGWRIERKKRELRLVDDRGAEHARRPDDAGAERALAAWAEVRRQTEHARLAARLPSPDEVARLLARDPRNTNLLWLRAAQQVLADAPDWVVVTGDLTDDGEGHELITAALAPFVERGRLLAVPGNHDIYDTPPLVVPGHARKDRRAKRAAWAAFAARLGLPGEGPWLRDLGDGVVVCGLDSCHPPRTPLSASGAVPDDDWNVIISALAGAPRDAVRLALLHHHVVNPPKRAIGVAPWQLGLRLRNARAAYDFFAAQQFAAVLNGHRHIGYRYHPSHAPMFIAAPSSTLGCLSGASDRPYYWRIDVGGGEVRSVKERPL